MRFSFLGLGNLGAPIAENILKLAGQPLTVYTRRKNVADEFAKIGATVAPNVAALADCDVLATCLPMPKDIVEAMTGEKGLYAAMKPGSIHLDFSTIEPATARALGATAAKRQIGYVQATVNKSPQVAREGKSPFFVGGDPASVEKVLPVLQKIGKPTNLKTLDAACGVKLLSNLIGMANVAIMAEGMRIGQLAGLEAHELIDLLLDTGSASYQMKMRGPMIADDDFAARFGLALAAKDLRLGCAMAAELGYEPKMMRQALQYLEEGEAEGLGAEDVCSVYKVTR